MFIIVIIFSLFILLLLVFIQCNIRNFNQNTKQNISNFTYFFLFSCYPDNYILFFSQLIQFCIRLGRYKRGVLSSFIFWNFGQRNKGRKEGRQKGRQEGQEKRQKKVSKALEMHTPPQEKKWFSVWGGQQGGLYITRWLYTSHKILYLCICRGIQKYTTAYSWVLLQDGHTTLKTVSITTVSYIFIQGLSD